MKFSQKIESVFLVGHFDFFCFIPMKTRMGQNFYQAKRDKHFLTHAKHFEGECK